MIPKEERVDATAFWARVERGAGCWFWQGAVMGKGYGHLAVPGDRGTFVRAHRVSWTLTFGSIPAGLWVLHRCDNRRCVRPDHLFLGTALDNNRDASIKGRHGSHLRPELRRGENSGTARLTWADVRDLRRRAADGEPATTLSRRFSVHPDHVRRIVRVLSWREP